MDSGGTTNFKIDKLCDSNFHLWRRKIELILGDKDLTDHITQDAPPSDASEDDSGKWFKRDAKAQAIIGLTLNDDHFEQVSDCKTAATMWKSILDLFQRKTLLNKLTTRRRFYSAQMGESEKAMGFIARVRQLAADCKAMDVTVDDQEIAMTVLCGLPQKYEHLIFAIDAATDDKSLTLDYVKSRLLQEEQRMVDRIDVKPARDAALVNERTSERGGRDVPVCSFCNKRNHTEPRCWKKYPHLRPKRDGGNASGLTAKGSRPATEPEDENSSVVCLMANASSAKVSRACEARWVIESGATSHICHDKGLFAEIENVQPFDISIGDDSNVRGIGRGTVELVLSVDRKPVKCRLSNVVFAPTMAYNMLGVRAMCRDGKRSIFEEFTCFVEEKSTGKVILQGTVNEDGLYCLDTHRGCTNTPVTTALAANLNLWHQRLAHVHVDGIRNMARHGVVEGMNVDLKGDLSRCKACVYGKSTRAPIPQKGGARSTHVLDLVHTDVCGPFPEQSLGGSMYFVSFVDDHSRYAWVYSIRAKSDVFERFKIWLAMVENQHGKRLQSLVPGATLKVLQSDNGGEYISTQMIRFLEQRGIQHRRTTPRNPHQNGVAERLNRTLVELVRAMLHHKSLPKLFWAEALCTAMHVRNRVTTRGLGARTTPYEVLFQRKPNLSYLRVFGSTCWYTLPRDNVDKLDPRAREAIMIGYARGSRGYKLWDVVDGKVVVSRDVGFDELGEYDERPAEPINLQQSVDEDTVAQPSCQHVDGNTPAAAVDTPGDGYADSGGESDDVPHGDDEFAPESETASSHTDEGGDGDEGQDGELRRSGRARKPPGRWWANVAALVSDAYSGDPRSYAEALSGPDGKAWKQSMQAEHDSLIENECFILVPRPANANVLRSMWVYKKKEGTC